MKKKDNENEYIGIISIVVIVILAAVGVYYYFSRYPQHEPNDISHTTISLKTESPQNVG